MFNGPMAIITKDPVLRGITWIDSPWEGDPTKDADTKEHIGSGL